MAEVNDAPPPADVAVPPPSSFDTARLRLLTYEQAQKELLRANKDWGKQSGCTIRLGLVGNPGVGKSSIVVSMTSAADGRVKAGITLVGGGSMHVTNTLRQFPNARLLIQDLWGLTMKIPDDPVALRMFVRGEIPIGTNRLEIMTVKPVPESERKPLDIVAIVFDSREIDNAEALEKTRSMIEILQKSSLVPINVIMTQCDHIDGAVLADPVCLMTSIPIATKRLHLADALGLPIRVVHPMTAFTEYLRFEESMQSYMLKVMQDMVNFGEDYRDAMGLNASTSI